jgi:hypothetical protein
MTILPVLFKSSRCRLVADRCGINKYLKIKSNFTVNTQILHYQEQPLKYVYWKKPLELINTLCGQNVQFANVKPGGTYSYHRALKCKVSGHLVKAACWKRRDWNYDWLDFELHLKIQSVRRSKQSRFEIVNTAHHANVLVQKHQLYSLWLV